GWLGLKHRRRELDPAGRGILAIQIWGLGSFVLLAAFYLKTPGISSRFLEDFAPAILASSLGLALLAIRFLTRDGRPGAKFAGAAFLCAFCGWFAVEIAIDRRPASRLVSNSPKAISASELADTLAARDRPYRIPASYQRGQQDDSNIPFNILGW